MNIKVIKTRKFLPPKDDLWSLIKESIPSLREKSVVCITSKIVSIGEGRCIPIESIKNKDELIVKEADFYLPRKYSPFGRLHTLKRGLLVGSSGIDESNGGDHYVLWPKNPDKSAKVIWSYLSKAYRVKNLGLVITDSVAHPLKRGAIGQAIAFYGFVHIKNYVGQKDLFGRKFKYTRTNIPDSLAAFAVYLMGEGCEQTPIVIFEDLPKIQFVSHTPRYKRKYTSWKVPIEEDIFRPFLKSVKWKKGKVST